MDAASAIELFLPEAANLNLGRLGVEIECLLRRDIRQRDGNFERDFNALLFRTKFIDGSDTSIERTPYTKDAYFVPFETANESPVEWSVLAPRLQQVLAWLRREDRVHVTRDSTMTYETVASSAAVVAEDPTLWKEMVLPRGKVPNNASSAVHLHFDIKDWFESPEHAAQFVKQFNRVGPESFKPAIHPPRYNAGGNQPRGDFHAKFVNTNPPAGWPAMLNPTYKKATQAAFYSVGGDRKQAMNCRAALKRGDVEFRFIHATLSFNTILGWFQALAELIEFSRLKMGDHSGDFKDYLSSEAPETEKFLKDRTARAARAVPHEPGFGKPYRDSRAVRRMAKAMNVGDPKDWAGLV